MKHISTRYRGFTIPELIIVITVGAILAGLLFGPLNDLYQSNNRSLKNVIKVADTRGSLRAIEHNITLAYAFDDSVTDQTSTTWNWTGAGSTNRVLITQNYATTIDEPQDTTGARTLVFSNTDCTTPLLNTYIYFVSNGTLYRRLVKSTGTPCSGSVAQKQTCAIGDTHAYCQATDATLLTGVTSFTIDYYSSAAATTAMANEYTDNTVPAAAKAIVVSVTANSGPGSIDTTYTDSLRIARVNGS